MNAVLTNGLLVTAVAATAAVAPASTSSASGHSHAGFEVHAPFVNANFHTIDPAGCFVTDVFVFVNKPTDADEESPGVAPDRITEVSVFRYDACTDTNLINATGVIDTLPAGAFTESRRLDRAHLETPVTLTDPVTLDTLTVDVDLTWTGTSAITRRHSNTNDRVNGCHVVNRLKVSSRTADATGTISDGTTNLTASTSEFAEIGYVMQGAEATGC